MGSVVLREVVGAKLGRARHGQSPPPGHVKMESRLADGVEWACPLQLGREDAFLTAPRGAETELRCFFVCGRRSNLGPRHPKRQRSRSSSAGTSESPAFLGDGCRGRGSSTCPPPPSTACAPRQPSPSLCSPERPHVRGRSPGPCRCRKAGALSLCPIKMSGYDGAWEFRVKTCPESRLCRRDPCRQAAHLPSGRQTRCFRGV